MTVEQYLEKSVAIQSKESNTLICKGKVVDIYGENHIYVLPEGVQNEKEAVGFAMNSTWFDIAIV